MIGSDPVRYSSLGIRRKVRNTEKCYWAPYCEVRVRKVAQVGYRKNWYDLVNFCNPEGEKYICKIIINSVMWPK